MPLFGAAYAYIKAPQFYTGFGLPRQFLILLLKVKFKDFSRSLGIFQVLFKKNVISRTFQDSPVYSSTSQACASPGTYRIVEQQRLS